MQAGRTLLKDKKESFVMTTEFLSGTDGRKMSKTWGNAIWLTDKPEEMFGKVMSITDVSLSNISPLPQMCRFTNIEEFKKNSKQHYARKEKTCAHNRFRTLQ